LKLKKVPKGVCSISPLEEIILSVLQKEKLYGLEIIRAVEEATEGRRSLGFGSLYPTLHKLQKRSLVKSEWGGDELEERAGARRRYYRITGAGQKALVEARELRDKIAAWQPALGRS
jgi:PadR family transcriptional regulator, regulatory protein PadR